ncbi:MAG: hypothetical protein EZS28_042912, partial [Streblomastix strix]
FDILAVGTGTTTIKIVSVDEGVYFDWIITVLDPIVLAQNYFLALADNYSLQIGDRSFYLTSDGITVFKTENLHLYELWVLHQSEQVLEIFTEGYQMGNETFRDGLFDWDAQERDRIIIKNGSIYQFVNLNLQLEIQNLWVELDRGQSSAYLMVEGQDSEDDLMQIPIFNQGSTTNPLILEYLNFEIPMEDNEIAYLSTEEDGFIYTISQLGYPSTIVNFFAPASLTEGDAYWMVMGDNLQEEDDSFYHDVRGHEIHLYGYPYADYLQNLVALETTTLLGQPAWIINNIATADGTMCYFLQIEEESNYLIIHIWSATQISSEFPVQAAWTEYEFPNNSLILTEETYFLNTYYSYNPTNFKLTIYFADSFNRNRAQSDYTNLLQNTNGWSLLPTLQGEILVSPDHHFGLILRPDSPIVNTLTIQLVLQPDILSTDLGELNAMTFPAKFGTVLGAETWNEGAYPNWSYAIRYQYGYPTITFVQANNGQDLEEDKVSFLTNVIRVPLEAI